jgi:hypothetical protein
MWSWFCRKIRICREGNRVFIPCKFWVQLLTFILFFEVVPFSKLSKKQKHCPRFILCHCRISGMKLCAFAKLKGMKLCIYGICGTFAKMLNETKRIHHVHGLLSIFAEYTKKNLFSFHVFGEPAVRISNFLLCCPWQRSSRSQVPSQVATHQEIGSQLWARETTDSNPGLQDNSLVRYHWATMPP